VKNNDLYLILNNLGDLFERPPEVRLGISHTSIPGQELVFEPSDEFAATHYRILCHELVPAASVFLEPHTMMGGTVSDAVWQFMVERGYEPDTRSITADHLATEFRFLGFLLEKERFDDVGRFVRQHLSSWIPVFLNRLEREKDSGMSQLASFVGSLLGEILCSNMNEHVHAEGYTKVPDTSFDIHSERTGLQDIGLFFASHTESGLFIPRSRLLTEARLHRLPTGFGSRARTIEGLFRSAGQYDAMDSICTFLNEEIAIHRGVWSTWATGDTTFGAAHWANIWSEKLDATTAIVSHLQSAQIHSVEENPGQE